MKSHLVSQTDVHAWRLLATIKARQAWVTLRQGGVAAMLQWTAFGYLRPHAFEVMSLDLDRLGTAPPAPPGLRFEVWDGTTLMSRASTRLGMATEFFWAEIAGLERCAVALAGDEPAGVQWIRRHGDLSPVFLLRAGEAELNNAFVQPAYRRRGVFASLVWTACDWLRREGHRHAFTLVHHGNAPSLRGLYRLGFRRRSTLRRFFAYRPRVSTAALPSLVP
jgi:GNAT superfamily N-acetyltransferase